MAIVEKVVEAPVGAVFAVLADGWTYSDWVVGTAHIRDVDDHWPAKGSKIYFKAGVWPVFVRDSTVVLSSDPPHELVMQARVRPVGEVTIAIRLTALSPTRTKVTFAEDFAAGPLRWVRTKLNDLVLHHRNKESLARLSDLAVNRRPVR
jgi:uncharacterized protein YndB with AHSA1/START domain